MTDEQVQEIVRALSEGGEPWWGPWALSAVTLIVGFLLSQLSERAKRARDRDKDRANARRAAALDAIAFTIETSVSTASMLRAAAETLPESISRRLAALRIADDSYDVGQWWVRQLMRVGSTGSGEFTAAENTRRSMVAVSVSTRLEAWAAGSLKPAEFKSSGDRAWDERMRIPADIETPGASEKS
ncbi:hypothetical protein [Microbacterium sp. NPDC089188]|uniref:hypothetical protein n=1 Tax=Microbacterium sp. NPDC089188 TaxID=3154971 RepID=UPI00343E1418